MTAPTGASVTVQDAVYAALAADASLTAWLAATPADPRIYEVLARPGTKLTRTLDGIEVPHPYVALQGGEEVPLYAMCSLLFTVPMTVKVWVPGTRERLAKIGAGHVRRILDGATLPLDGHTVMSVTVERMRPQTDEDGAATQAMTDIRVDARAT